MFDVVHAVLHTVCAVLCAECHVPRAERLAVCSCLMLGDVGGVLRAAYCVNVSWQCSMRASIVCAAVIGVTCWS